MRAKFVALVAVLVPLQAGAEIYRCRDAAGQLYYTATRPASCYPRTMRGAQVINDAGAGSRTSESRRTAPDFPRVDRATQAARDATRREILEAELSAELRLRASAKDAEATEHHARNIEALRKELSYTEARK